MSPNTTALSPWDTIAEAGSQQIAHACDSTFALLGGMENAARFWQEMTVAAFAMQAQYLHGIGMPDPEAMLAAANVLE